MAATACVTLQDLQIDTVIGHYGPGDVVPGAHLLDMVLHLPAALVLVDRDAMEAVFDYDPLIARIDRIARAQHYETQEFLLSRIARACAEYPQITALQITLRKSPVLGESGTLGVSLTLDEAEMAALRAAGQAQGCQVPDVMG